MGDDSFNKTVSDERWITAPDLPADRPPTRREVWDRNWHIFQDYAPKATIAKASKEEWVWRYVNWYNRACWQVLGKEQWDKQPDWTPERPVVAAAVPTRPFVSGDPSGNTREVYRLLRIAEGR
jgi:hypothetical protein